MRPIPEGLEQAFSATAGELGMCCASWLFAENVARAGGSGAVAALRDALGRAFPVLDSVCVQWDQGTRLTVDAARTTAALSGTDRVVVVGLEAFFLDALIGALPAKTQVALLRHSAFPVDWERVIANYGERVSLVDLASFQGWASARSALLTFAYGVQGASAHVAPEWLRATGEDVRTQFRSLVAWDVLRAPMFVYPRWLVEVGSDSFTEVL